jgi:predicted ribosomally synthesized peptide with nif11-like leader
MVKMKELYEKITGDSTLQAKFGEILNEAEKAGRQATDLRLAAFAKEAGYDISAEEMREFFRDLAEKRNGELSDAELDSVAGGIWNPYNILISRVQEGCVQNSLMDPAAGRSCWLFL